MTHLFWALLVIAGCSVQTNVLSEDVPPSILKVRAGLVKDGKREVAVSHPTSTSTDAQVCLIENQQCGSKVFSLARDTTVTNIAIYRSLEIPSDLIGELQFKVGDETRTITFEKPSTGTSKLKDEYNLDLVQNTRSTKLADELSGKRFAIIDFGASWCGPCQTFIRSTYPQYKTKLDQSESCKFISIADSKDYASWVRFVGSDLATHAYSVESLSSAMSDKFNVGTSLPTIVLLDLSTGTIVESDVGASKPAFEKMVNQCVGG